MTLDSFRGQLTLVFGGLAVAMSTVVSIAIGTLVYDGIAAEQARTLGGIAAFAGAAVAEGLRERLHEIEWIAASTDTLTAAPEANRRTLERLQHGEPAYAWIAITDADGVVRVESTPGHAGRGMAESPWFAGARNGPYVGDVHPADTLRRPSPPGRDDARPRFVDLAAPLFHEGGGFGGVLVAHIHWRWIVDLLERVRVEPLDDQDFVLFLFDRHGAPIYRSRSHAAAEPRCSVFRD